MVRHPANIHASIQRWGRLQRIRIVHNLLPIQTTYGPRTVLLLCTHWLRCPLGPLQSHDSDSNQPWMRRVTIFNTYNLSTSTSLLHWPRRALHLLPRDPSSVTGSTSILYWANILSGQNYAHTCQLVSTFLSFHYRKQLDVWTYNPH